jgi:hypothetical protein
VTAFGDCETWGNWNALIDYRSAYVWTKGVGGGVDMIDALTLQCIFK